MKLQLYTASEVPEPRGPAPADPYDTAGRAYHQVSRDFAQLSNETERTAGALLEFQRREQEAKNAVDTNDLVGQGQRAIAAKDIELRSDPKWDYRTHDQKIDEFGRKIIQDTAGKAPNQIVGARVTRELNRGLTERVIHAKYDAKVRLDAEAGNAVVEGVQRAIPDIVNTDNEALANQKIADEIGKLKYATDHDLIKPHQQLILTQQLKAEVAVGKAQQLIDLDPQLAKARLKEREGEKYLYQPDIPQAKREELIRQADVAFRTNLSFAWQQKEHERAEMQRAEKERWSQNQYTLLKRFRGDPGTTKPTIPEIDSMIQNRQIDPEHGEHVRDMMMKGLIDGGEGNPNAVRDLGIRVAAIDSTPNNVGQVRALKAELMRAMRPDPTTGKVQVPFSVGNPWLFRLNEKEGAQATQLTHQTSEMKAFINRQLATEGPLATIVNTFAQDVRGEAEMMLDKNEASKNPISPIQLVEENLAKWKARIRINGVAAVHSKRSAEGLGVRPETGPDTKFEQAVQQQKEEWKLLDSNPKSDPDGRKRRELIDRGRRLKELKEQQDALDALKKSPDDPPRQPTSPSTGRPLQGPR